MDDTTVGGEGAPQVDRFRWSWDKANRWLALAANLGVILGLVILVIEVRQNAALTKSMMEQQKNDLLVQIEANIGRPEMSTIWVKSIRSPEAMTDAEIQSAASVLVGVMLQWDQMFQMEAAGLISRDRVRQHIENVAPFYFGSRFAKHWWALQMSGWEGTPMQEVAGPVVDSIDDNFLADYMDSLHLVPPADVTSSAEPDGLRAP